MGTVDAYSRPIEPYLNTRTTKASMKLKVVNTNRLRDSHCGSRTQALVHAQPHVNSHKTIELPLLVIFFSFLFNNEKGLQGNKQTKWGRFSNNKTQMKKTIQMKTQIQTVTVGNGSKKVSGLSNGHTRR